MKVSPGPANGPVPIEAGAMTSTAKLAVSGGSPGTLTLSGGTNPSTIAPEAHVPLPTATGRVTATGAVGSNVSYTPGALTFTAPSLGDARVACTPGSDTVVLTSAIVDEPLTGPAPSTAAAAAAPPASPTRARALIAAGTATTVAARRLRSAPDPVVEPDRPQHGARTTRGADRRAPPTGARRPTWVCHGGPPAPLPPLSACLVGGGRRSAWRRTG